MSHAESQPPREAPQSLHDAAVLAAVMAQARGRYEEALAYFGQALRAAEAMGDRRRVHAAHLNMSSCHLGLGDTPSARLGLPAIILESSDPVHVSAAAGQMAEAFMKEGRLERAAQYLRTALEQARESGDMRREASALIMAGQLAVMEGRHAEAVDQYSAALAIQEEVARRAGPAPSPLDDLRGAVAAVLDNLGYALLLAGRHREGLQVLRRAVRLARSIGNALVEAEARKDVAFGFLLVGRHRSTERHALAALALADRHGFSAVIRNATYLLMEAALRSGRTVDFDGYFDRLQAQIPDVRLSREFFRTFDITDVINLKEF